MPKKPVFMRVCGVCRFNCSQNVRLVNSCHHRKAVRYTVGVQVVCPCKALYAPCRAFVLSDDCLPVIGAERLCMGVVGRDYFPCPFSATDCVPKMHGNGRRCGGEKAPLIFPVSKNPCCKLSRIVSEWYSKHRFGRWD